MAVTRDALTDRQQQVYDLVAEGMTQAQIADELDLAVRTVEFHVQRIGRRLGFTGEIMKQIIIHSHQRDLGV